MTNSESFIFSNYPGRGNVGSRAYPGNTGWEYTLDETMAPCLQTFTLDNIINIPSAGMFLEDKDKSCRTHWQTVTRAHGRTGDPGAVRWQLPTAPPVRKKYLETLVENTFSTHYVKCIMWTSVCKLITYHKLCRTQWHHTTSWMFNHS